MKVIDEEINRIKSKRKTQNARLILEDDYYNKNHSGNIGYERNHERESRDTFRSPRYIASNDERDYRYRGSSPKYIDRDFIDTDRSPKYTERDYKDTDISPRHIDSNARSNNEHVHNILGKEK